MVPLTVVLCVAGDLDWAFLAIVACRAMRRAWRAVHRAGRARRHEHRPRSALFPWAQ
jgi:hypothetical protein